METILLFVGSILMLVSVCILGSLVLAKGTKEFHIHFELFNGFDVSGTFSKKTITRKSSIVLSFRSRRVVVSITP